MDRNVAKNVMSKVLSKLFERRFDRDKLKSGASHEVSGTVTARVDGTTITEEFAAVLSVGHDSQRANRAAVPKETVLGYVLSKVDKPETLVSRVVKHFTTRQEMPRVADKYSDLARQLFQELASTQTVTKRGDIAVTPIGGPPY